MSEQTLLSSKNIKNAITSVLPPMNASKDDDYFEMLISLEEIGINTWEKWEAFAREYLPKIREEAEEAGREYRHKGEMGLPGVDKLRAKKGVFFSHTGLLALMIGKYIYEKNKPR